MKTMIKCATLLALVGTVATTEARPLFGLVEPLRDVNLSLTVPGRLASIYHREGSRVEQGDLILSLDARMEQLEVERRVLIYEDHAELEAARARSALIGNDLQSTRALFERTASVSREELDRKELEFKLSQLEIARLEQAKQRERVERDMALEQVGLRQIIAPFDGVVADLFFDEGEGVQANQIVVRLVSDQRCYLVVNAPAHIVAGVAMGDSANLRFEGAPPILKEGSIAFISPVVDAASGLRRVKIEFDNETNRVEPGVAGQWLWEGRP